MAVVKISCVGSPMHEFHMDQPDMQLNCPSCGLPTIIHPADPDMETSIVVEELPDINEMFDKVESYLAAVVALPEERKAALFTRLTTIADKLQDLFPAGDPLSVLHPSADDRDAFDNKVRDMFRNMPNDEQDAFPGSVP